MKRFHTLLLFCIAATLFSSCQKQFNEETDNLDPVDPNAVRLKRYISLDTSSNPLGDTIFAISYAYDNLNRCTSALYQYFDYPAFQDSATMVENFFYNGNDTLIDHINRIYNEPGNPAENTSEYFTYNNAGILVKDSLNYDMNRTVFHYRYEGNTVHSISVFSGVPSDTALYSKHLLAKTNGNISSEKDSAWIVYNSWPYSQHTTTDITASYDNHPNPLFRLVPAWPVFWESEHFFQGDISMQQKNNFLSTSITVDGIVEGTHTYQFNYLTNGYPSSAVNHFVQPGFSDYYRKVIYQYY